MKKILWIINGLLVLIGTWGCVMNGAYHASGTLIGIEIGTPEIGSVAIGYRMFNITVVGDNSSSNISTFTKAGTSGLDTSKQTIFNEPNKLDYIINESREK